MSITQLTATDHAELDAFWARPARPMTPIDPTRTPGAYTVTITCRVCGARQTLMAFVDGLLCNACRADLDAAEATVQTQLEAIKAEEAQAMGMWTEVQANLDDVTAERWVRLSADRDRVVAQLQRARTDKYYNWSDERIAQNIAEKQSAYDEVMARIARTAEKPGALGQLLKGYDLWQAELAKLNERRQSCERGLMEIDAARPGGAPF